ncbi:hypothetical protein COO60DRAFT_1496819 [Scenedesmus sp. NREL 46B-D3]|nr:hypothetical protein COO60DRAFT_1496819 [Scenedesmus sp. NREL 46B-D3]
MRMTCSCQHATWAARRLLLSWPTPPAPLQSTPARCCARPLRLQRQPASTQQTPQHPTVQQQHWTPAAAAALLWMALSGRACRCWTGACCGRSSCGSSRSGGPPSPRGSCPGSSCSWTITRLTCSSAPRHPLLTVSPHTWRSNTQTCCCAKTP